MPRMLGSQEETPSWVTTDGSPDPNRAVVYLGEAEMFTSAGVLPLVFELEVSSLADAVAQFGVAAQAALERAVEELERLHREAQSAIVVPKTMPRGTFGDARTGTLHVP